MWATYQEQARNRREQHLVTYRGKEQSLAAWVEELGLNYKIVHQRLARGWTVEQAFVGSR